MPGITYTDNTITSPVWAADYLSRDHLVPGPIELDPSAFDPQGTVRGTVTVNDADVNATETSITVVALPVAIPAGTVLQFSGAGAGFAKVTAAAAAGATSLTVEALPEDIDNGATATYLALTTNAKRVVAGTYVGRTFAERETNSPFGPCTSGDEERFLIAFDILDLDDDASGTAVRPGTAIKENFLPEYSSMSSTIKGYLRADYVTQKGAA